MFRRSNFKASITTLLVITATAALTITSVHAQTSAATATRAATQPADGNLRLFQQFFEDAAITSQWWGVEARIQNGAVPPIQNADGRSISPVIAISPVRNLELGGRVSWLHYNLDHAITVPAGSGTRTIDGNSGATDIEFFGKYRVMLEPVQLAFGASVTLPTGSKDDGLGTGKVVPMVFGAVRKELGNYIAVAHLGLRFNPDVDLLSTHLNGKTSTSIGGGIIAKVSTSFNWTGEVTVESERFSDAPGLPAASDIRATAGAQWLFAKHHILRAALSAGLSDGAPSYELIGGYAYWF